MTGNIRAEYTFDRSTILSTIHTKWAAQTVHFVLETDSTNELAKRLAREGAPHGTLVVAELQTEGKGRLGRRWTAPAGTSVMMSLLLRPSFAPDAAPMLTLVMGLSVAQAVGRLRMKTSIKWPNDVALSRKKICGILTEMNLEKNRIREVIIGVGINVNVESFPEDLADKATSLRLESGKYFDRSMVTALVLERFEENYEKFLKTCDLSLLKEDYNGILANRGKKVKVLEPVRPYEGTALGINDAGELLVRRRGGYVESIRSGEVSVRGLYSYV